MDNRPAVVLDGNNLSMEDVVAIGMRLKQVRLDEDALVRCRASRTFLKKEINAGKIIYGVNTSFGPMCNRIISEKDIELLQVNLIKSHAAGLGEPIKPEVALAVLAIRCNTLLKGFSGVRVQLLEVMQDMINQGISPFIPECGSVGASGDLVHLSHMSLAIIGLGNVYYDNALMPADKALEKAGIKPVNLSYKEGLALINGTAAMSALAAFALKDAEKTLKIACINAAFAMEIFGGIDDAFDMDLQTLKPHSGQMNTAAAIGALFQGSGNITKRDDLHDLIRNQQSPEDPFFTTNLTVQDVYSIRCTPQILAPVDEAVSYAVEKLQVEINSSNDNPLIIPEKGKILHGGNFHGQSIGFAMDSLCIAISTLCNLSERRVNKLLDKNLNGDLPENLIPGTVGLTMGLMGAQYLATSTTAENRNLANPVSTHSISSNESNQDVVSMGTIAARKALTQVNNAKHILTVETIALMQALSFKNAATLGRGTAKIHTILNQSFEIYDNSRIIHDDLVKFRDILFSTTIFDDLTLFCQELDN